MTIQLSSEVERLVRLLATKTGKTLDDVVEEAMEEALAQGLKAEVVVGNADLDVLGRIGAFLRY